jgi:membrane-bound lytic murein transglycosylase D
MSYLDRRRSSLIKFLSIFLLAIAASGCDSVSPDDMIQSTIHRTNLTGKKLTLGQSTQLWERVRKNYSIPKTFSTKNVAEKRVQQFVKHYAQEEQYWSKIGVKASPYLFYIVEQLEARNMPGELALLPILESAFEPHATSHKGAAGLWQFIPGTGRSFGLKQDRWYDGRRDIAASTTAALDYLSTLHKQFDENWMLALAAYNAGEGRVQQAINKNKKAGISTSFWSLSLPQETKDYIPKLLALAEVVRHPEKHSVSLPLIENKPYFIHIELGKHLDFHKVAKLADINIQEVKRLNPGYRRASTHPTGPQQLLLPIANAAKLLNNLVGSKERSRGVIK